MRRAWLGGLGKISPSATFTRENRGDFVAQCYHRARPSIKRPFEACAISEVDPFGGVIRSRTGRPLSRPLDDSLDENLHALNADSSIT